MRLIVRGYGNGKLVFEERVEVATDDLEAVAPIATSQIERLANYDVPGLLIEFLDEPDPNTRFYSLGRVPNYSLPTHCEHCGAVLMGGATKHEAGCGFKAIIDQFFGKVN